MPRIQLWNCSGEDVTVTPRPCSWHVLGCQLWELDTASGITSSAGPGPWLPCSYHHGQSLPHHPSSLYHKFQILSLWWMHLIVGAWVTCLGPHCREIWKTMNIQHFQLLCCLITWPSTKNPKAEKFANMGKEFRYFLGNQKRMTNVHCDRVVLTTANSKFRGLSLASFPKKLFEKGIYTLNSWSQEELQSPRNTLIYHNRKKAIQHMPKKQLFPWRFKQQKPE